MKDPPESLRDDQRPPISVERTVLRVDNVELDVDGMLLWVDDRQVDITPQEFGLLKVLIQNSGKVLSREELLTLAWRPDRGRMSNTLSVLISRIRRKLRRPDGSSRIRTVRGIGYALDTSAHRRPPRDGR